MPDRKRELLATLSDGKFHSGESLAKTIQVSRAAVWKHINTLKEMGLEISSIRGKGYSLINPIDLLDSQAILAHLDNRLREKLEVLDIHFELNSTNQHLLDKLKSGQIDGHVVAAEFQSSGKGRGNNKWLSAPACGICFSLGWSFESTPGSLNALSLATGVAIADALDEIGCPGIKLKWPNDIIAGGAKLGGILIETQGQVGGKCDAVIGVGINVHMPEQLAVTIEQDVTDIVREIQQRPSRSFMLAVILCHLIISLEKFSRYGFPAFIDRWRKLDHARNKNAVLILANEKISGKVMGIDENGLLVLNVNGQNHKFSSGEISLRTVN